MHTTTWHFEHLVLPTLEQPNIIHLLLLFPFTFWTKFESPSYRSLVSVVDFLPGLLAGTPYLFK